MKRSDIDIVDISDQFCGENGILLDRDHAIFEVVSGKGAYMRGLARDLALKLGTLGHISMLRRLAVGPFDEGSAISLDKLEALGHSAPPVDCLMAVETVLDDIPALALTENEAGNLRHGQPVAVLPVANRSSLGCGHCHVVEYCIAHNEGDSN